MGIARVETWCVATCYGSILYKGQYDARFSTKL